MRHKSLLDRMVDSFVRTLDEWGAMMCTREFWGIVAIGTTVLGFVISALIMLIKFDPMRMRNCFNASNMNAYLMFNVLMFFSLAGVMSLGEAFNYFDNKKRGIPHKLGSIFWLIMVTTTLGSVGLVMLKISC